MSNIYMVDMSHEYYVDIARKLLEKGHTIKVIGASRAPEYWPQSLDEFVSAAKPKVTFWEELNFPEEFEKILDPDFSVLGLEMMSDLASAEKLFLLSTDRLSFFPLSQADRCRLFYRFVGHFYKILKRESIDCVLFFGTPHGPWSIALFELAGVLGLKSVYTDWVGLSPDLSTIETSIAIRRTYTPADHLLGVIANPIEAAGIHQIVTQSRNKAFVWTATKHINRFKVVSRMLGSLLVKRPFAKYISPEFFLNAGNRRRISYAPALLGYFAGVYRALKYYDSHTTNAMPDRNSLVLFLHLQPEASTMPMGGVFADQLLVLDLILGALPSEMNVFVKEHPFMFEAPAQDRHERSVAFYTHMLKDKRVNFVKRTINSMALIENAGFVASVAGSISWEAMRLGTPSIIFGWAWFSGCKSCFSVDSVSTLQHAFSAASKKTRDEVKSDVEQFLGELEKRLVYAAACRPALNYLGDEFPYSRSVENLANAINIAIASHSDNSDVAGPQVLDSLIPNT